MGDSSLSGSILNSNSIDGRRPLCTMALFRVLRSIRVTTWNRWWGSWEHRCYISLIVSPFFGAGFSFFFAISICCCINLVKAFLKNQSFSFSESGSSILYYSQSSQCSFMTIRWPETTSRPTEFLIFRGSSGESNPGPILSQLYFCWPK